MGRNLRDNLLRAVAARQAGDLAALKSMEEAQAKRESPSQGLSKGQTKGQAKGQTKGLSGQSKGQTSGPSCGQSGGQRDGQTNGLSTGASVADEEAGRIEHFRPAIGPRTKSESAVWKFLLDHKRIIISLRDLAEEVRVPEATARKVLRRLESQGFLSKKKAPGNGGMVLNFSPDGQTCGQTLGQTCGLSTPPSKIDREDLNLSISLEEMELNWPRLVAAGFGPKQVEQIESNLRRIGESTKQLLRGLTYAEWELENGRMLDKKGEPVKSPCDWVFHSLARTGYYRRPTGFVSAEEQAVRDEADELERMRLERARLAQERFLAWRDSLTPDERKKALQGHPGGPVDPWLRKKWEEAAENGDRDAK